MKKEKYIRILLVKGVEGFSLNVVDSEGYGKRIAGSKPWCGGKIVGSFTIKASELIDAIKKNSFIKKTDQTEKGGE